MAIKEPLLTIPGESEGSAAFKERVGRLVADSTTHFYVDTSFLMWMTKIGVTSRGELIRWLEANCAGRIHVPVWAAHEYLRHHVAGTIVCELSDKTDEIANVVGRTYTYFRPFVDEPLGKIGEDAAMLRASTRDALNALQRLASVTRQWYKSYPAHAAEVIAFINSRVPRTTQIYNYFSGIGALGSGRYSGSIPPGFQDRRKKGDEASDAGSVTDEVNQTPAGSNRFGDLLFWKEVLDHAKDAAANCIIILTNDRKNDWYLGRGETENIESELLEIRKAWKPVPRAHPMLALEAKLVAKVGEVVLLDSPYLAVVLRELALDDVRAFADVAIIPDGPQPQSEAARRENALQKRLLTEAAQAEAKAAEQGIRFLDDPRVLFSQASLRRALLESRVQLDDSVLPLLEALRATAEGGRPIGEIITKDRLEGLDHKQLVRFSRDLHDRVIAGESGYETALTDLVSLLDELPLHTASCFYLGLLASMYLERASNAVRLPPRSPVTQLLFVRQQLPYAALPISTLVKRIGDDERHPLYQPNVDRPDIPAVFDIEPDTTVVDELRSLKIAGIEVVTPAQHDDTLKFATLFPNLTADIKSILSKACEVFGLPADQIQVGEGFERIVALTPTVGFKRPEDVFIPKEDALG